MISGGHVGCSPERPGGFFLAMASFQAQASLPPSKRLTGGLGSGCFRDPLLLQSPESLPSGLAPPHLCKQLKCKPWAWAESPCGLGEPGVLSGLFQSSLAPTSCEGMEETLNLLPGQRLTQGHLQGGPQVLLPAGRCLHTFGSLGS